MAGSTKPIISAEVVRRLTLSRYYLGLAKEHARVDREHDVFVTINLLHEAVETFLVAAAQHVNASIKAKTDFITYIDKIDEKIVPRELPFRTTLNRLNKARVSAKHDIVVPDRSEIPDFVSSASSFFDEASEMVFDTSFSSVSLIDLIGDAQVKEHLLSAQTAFEERRHQDVLIECRKALYVVFEQFSDVSRLTAESGLGALFGYSSQAPFYARSAEYVERSVFEPFDYIVLDNSRVDNELMKDGLDPHIYWNLWRLTPAVYKTMSGEWLVKNEIDKLSDETSADNSAYVLENSINLLFQRDRKRRGLRSPRSGLWQIPVRNAKANIYRKASRASEVLETIPEAVEHLQVQSSGPGLDGGYYWKILRWNSPGGATWFYGYVHEDDASPK